MMVRSKYAGHWSALGRSYSMGRDCVPLHGSSSIGNEQQQRHDGTDEDKAAVELSDMGMAQDMYGGSRVMDVRMNQ